MELKKHIGAFSKLSILLHPNLLAKIMYVYTFDWFSIKSSSLLDLSTILGC